MRMLLTLGAATLIVAAAPAGRRPQAAATDPNSGAEWIGRPAPGWSFDRWIGTRPLTLAK